MGRLRVALPTVVGADDGPTDDAPVAGTSAPSGPETTPAAGTIEGASEGWPASDEPRIVRWFATWAGARP